MGCKKGKKKKRKGAYMLPFLLLVGCGPKILPDAIQAPVCEAAAERMAKLGCIEQGDKEFFVWACDKVLGSGYVWDSDKSGPECIVKAETMDDLINCNVKCQ